MIKLNRDFNFWDGLTLLFIYFKMTGQIDWSWLIVLLPFYGQVFLINVLSIIIKAKMKEMRRDG